MKDKLKDTLVSITSAEEVIELERIQNLWSGYGTLKRYKLLGVEPTTVIVKHVAPPTRANHPRGWHSDTSHRRKLKSYQVETSWYQQWSMHCSKSCYVPQCIGVENLDAEFLIVLEDLDASGFEVRKSHVSMGEIQACLKWLAHFHATFLGREPSGLWECGTYWHLATRPDELAVLKDRNLKSAAAAIDQKLREAKFQSFVHGDAKLANFCFSSDGKRVAAVDFQYVGGGCGMKDVAYFVGSCLAEDECETYEEKLLEYYFSVLSNVLRRRAPEIPVQELEEEWRSLYRVAWADFHRFLKGWSPEHWKINSYSERVTREVVESCLS